MGKIFSAGLIAIGQGAVREGRFRLHIRKNFFMMRVVKTLEQIAQRGSGGPIPGNIQGWTAL